MRRARAGHATRRQMGATVVLGILGVAVWLGLPLVTPTVAPEPGQGVLTQALWRDPIPSRLAPGVAVREAPAVGRSLLPTDPPRALVVPPATRDEAKASTAPGGIPVRVYFSRLPSSDSSPWAVFPVSRVAANQAVATAALAALIVGPNAAERATGYYSELSGALTDASTCSGREFGITIADGTSTVRFCRTMVTRSAAQDARIRSQIEATLRQFRTIGAIRLLGSDGRCAFDRRGQDGSVATQAAAQ